MKSVRKKQYKCNCCWDQTLDLYGGLLEFYAAYLLPCPCTKYIVTQVEGKVRNAIVPDEFKVGYLLRTMVQTVISHLRECSQESDAREPSSRDECFEAVESLPPQERLVFFLREILEYRTRDASLLLGMSDAQVEELLSFAHKRIEQQSQQTASSATGYAHWQQFRWTFSDLGRC